MDWLMLVVAVLFTCGGLVLLAWALWAMATDV